MLTAKHAPPVPFGTSICRILIASLMLAGGNAMSLEQPDYSVEYTDGDIEYRRYAPYLVAETVIENVDDYNDAGNEGFRRLFRYITGANTSQAEISMTAPVQQTPSSEKISMTAPVQQAGQGDGWRVAFMLPAQYTLESAPVPKDPRVTIERVPARLVAVLRYSGRWTQRNFDKKRTALLAAIDTAGVTPAGELQSALYNPPFTPPFMRRNEVMVEVDRLPATAEAVAAGAY